MRVMYGHEYAAPRIVFLALGVGVAFYLVAATLSQALLAIDAAKRACLAWLASAVVLVVAYASFPGESLNRVAYAFAAGSLVLLLGLARLVYGTPATR
jgi:hypothetical protein